MTRSFDGTAFFDSISFTTLWTQVTPAEPSDLVG
jgi:hypothetical protein